ncbi:hypothetical protein D3C81_899330 [compost metagenome]
MIIAFGVDGSPVLDEHTVVIQCGGVLDLLAGFDAGESGDPRSKVDGDARVIHRPVRVLDHLPSGDIGDADVGDRHRGIVAVTIDEIHASFSSSAEGADLDHSALATLQLHDIEHGRLCIEHGGEVDVRFNIRFVLVQVGNGHILPGAGDEGETDTFLFHDHLVVGAEGGRAARLAGIDRIARGDVGTARLVGRVLAGGDDRRVGDAQDAAIIDDGRVRGGEHQEQVLAGGGVGQAECQVLAGADEHLVQQIEGIVRVARDRVHQRLVFHRPDLAATDGRSGFFDITREDDRTCWPASPAQHDIVVAIGVEQDVDAIEGIQPAVQAVEGRAKAVGEADVGDAASRCRGDGERIAPGVAHGPGIAAQGGTCRGTGPQCGQTGREGGGQGRHQDVVVVGIRGRAWCGCAVLQPGRFVQRHAHTGRRDARHAVCERRRGHHVVGTAEHLVGTRGGCAEQEGGARRVVGIDVPRGGDAAVDLAVEIASAAVGHVPGGVTLAGYGGEDIVGGAPLVIRTGARGMVHLECDRAASREAAGRDGGGAAGAIVVQVGGDGWWGHGRQVVDGAAVFVRWRRVVLAHSHGSLPGTAKCRGRNAGLWYRPQLWPNAMACTSADTPRRAGSLGLHALVPGGRRRTVACCSTLAKTSTHPSRHPLPDLIYLPV